MNRIEQYRTFYSLIELQQEWNIAILIDKEEHNNKNILTDQLCLTFVILLKSELVYSTFLLPEMSQQDTMSITSSSGKKFCYKNTQLQSL